MKMEPRVSSETSAIRTQTPGNYPKRNKLHLVYTFYFNQQCKYIYILFEQYLYYNHSYMFRHICFILREFRNLFIAEDPALCRPRKHTDTHYIVKIICTTFYQQQPHKYMI